MIIALRAGTLNLKGPQSPTGIDRGPQEGFLVLTGLALTVALSVAMPAGALTLHGLTPSTGGDQGPQMPAGAVVLQGLAPTPIVQTVAIVVPAGSEVWHGLTPIAQVITHTCAPPAGSLVFKGPARPQEVPQPLAGTVVLTGYVPLATVGGGGSSPQINVGAGTLVLAGQVPLALPNRSILVGAGSLVLSGQYIAVAFSPLQAGSLLWTGLIPTVQTTGAKVVMPGVGTLVAHGLTSIVFLEHRPSPAAAVLGLAGQVPSVVVTVVDPQTPTPGAGSLVLSGQTPTVSSTVTVTPQPGAGTLTFSSTGPVLAIDNAPQLLAGQLVLTGHVPVASNLPTPDVGRLVLSGQRLRVVNSGVASAIPPLSYGSGLFFYQSQRRS